MGCAQHGVVHDVGCADCTEARFREATKNDKFIKRTFVVGVLVDVEAKNAQQLDEAIKNLYQRPPWMDRFAVDGNGWFTLKSREKAQSVELLKDVPIVD